MKTEKEFESGFLVLEHPFLLGIIFTILYGVIVYLPDLLDLENILFADNLPPFFQYFL